MIPQHSGKSCQPFHEHFRELSNPLWSAIVRCSGARCDWTHSRSGHSTAYFKLSMSPVNRGLCGTAHATSRIVAWYTVDCFFRHRIAAHPLHGSPSTRQLDLP